MWCGSIAIQDEVGLIDINQADVPLLAGLFRAIGRAGEQTDTIVDRIIDWRDTDELRRLHGAEAGEYNAAELPNRPRNAPFQSVGELRLVLGMTLEIFRRVEPFVTVFSNRQAVDPRFAPREVLLALSGGGPGSQPRRSTIAPNMTCSAARCWRRCRTIRPCRMPITA